MDKDFNDFIAYAEERFPALWQQKMECLDAKYDDDMDRLAAAESQRILAFMELYHEWLKGQDS